MQDFQIVLWPLPRVYWASPPDAIVQNTQEGRTTEGVWESASLMRDIHPQSLLRAGCPMLGVQSLLPPYVGPHGNPLLEELLGRSWTSASGNQESWACSHAAQTSGRCRALRGPSSLSWPRVGLSPLLSPLAGGWCMLTPVAPQTLESSGLSSLPGEPVASQIFKHPTFVFSWRTVGVCRLPRADWP